MTFDLKNDILSHKMTFAPIINIKCQHDIDMSKIDKNVKISRK